MRSSRGTAKWILPIVLPAAFAAGCAITEPTSEAPKYDAIVSMVVPPKPVGQPPPPGASSGALPTLGERNALSWYGERIQRGIDGRAAFARLKSLESSGRAALDPPPTPRRPPQRGICSWVGQEHQGFKTASGGRFDRREYVAAHRSLPFGTIVRVRNLDNGREVIVKITDRGPFINGRIIDISEVAARDIGILVKGLCQAEIQPLN